MELDVRLDDRAIGVSISDPYHPDIDGIMRQISAFLEEQGMGELQNDVAGLLPLLIRGVVGCEEGCPANAKDLVEQGYGDFTLRYVEGGILTAQRHLDGDRNLTLNLFPEF
jgi:hypothetical protein